MITLYLQYLPLCMLFATTASSFCSSRPKSVFIIAINLSILLARILHRVESMSGQGSAQQEEYGAIVLRFGGAGTSQSMAIKAQMENAQ